MKSMDTRLANKRALSSLSEDQRNDLKLASSKMSGAKRREFQAEMTLKYCNGKARQAERVFNWCRHSVELGLNELRTGIRCEGMQSAFGGDKLWEEKQLKAAKALWKLAEDHSQQDPTFRTTLSYTRLTAAEALRQLRKQGFTDDQLPSLRRQSRAVCPGDVVQAIGERQTAFDVAEIAVHLYGDCNLVLM